MRMSSTSECCTTLPAPYQCNNRAPAAVITSAGADCRGGGGGGGAQRFSSYFADSNGFNADDFATLRPGTIRQGPDLS